MATLASIASGDLTSATTWALADTTSFLESTAGTSRSTTSFLASQNFTPGAITISALGVYLETIAAAPTGTFTVQLYNSTAAAVVTGTTISINVTDIGSGTGGIGWYVFQFATPVTLVGGDAYNVQIKSSTNSEVTLYTNGTADNWARMLLTTTNQAPAAGDQLLIQGQWTGPAALTSYTVTMDSTGGITYGNTTNCVEISKGGTLTWGTSTDTQLVIAGSLNIWNGGTVNLNSTAGQTSQLTFSLATAVSNGLIINMGATFSATGNALTTDRAYLAANATASATSLTTDRVTNWVSGTEIAIASTTQTSAQTETVTLTASASGTTLTTTALVNAHSGTSPTQAEIINLNRSVKIFSTTATTNAYITIATTAIVTMSWVEIYNMGSATSGTRGINVLTSTGNCNLQNCSFHDYTVSGVGVFLGSAANNNITVSNNVFWNCASRAYQDTSLTSTNATITISNNWAMGNSVATTALFLVSNFGRFTFTNNVATSSSGQGFEFADSNSQINFTPSGLVAHSNTDAGFLFDGTVGGSTGMTNAIVTNLISWANNTYGIQILSSYDFTINTANIFSNRIANISITTESANILWQNITVNAGATLASPIGLDFLDDAYFMYFDNCSFGVTTAHSTGDINAGVGIFVSNIVFRNSTMSSPTLIANRTINLYTGANIAFQKLNGIAGNHYYYGRNAVSQPDTIIYRTNSISQRVTPNNATAYIEHAIMQVAVRNGTTASISVYVRMSVVGDGAVYNGFFPTLILKADPAMGITSDIVLATATSAASGAWQLLTATTPAITDNGAFKVVIACNGTTGWINVDNWSAR